MNRLRKLTGQLAWRRLPWYLPVVALGMCAIGAAFIWSSHSLLYARKHIVFSGAGLIAFLTVAVFDYRRLSGITLPLYCLGLVALMGLWSPLGLQVSGARRWYDLGFFHVQPSEPMKYLLVLALADHFRFQHRLDRMRDLLLALAMAVVPAALIAAQPDFGSAVLLAPVFFAMAFLAGARMRNLALLVVAGCVLLVGAWFTPGVMQDYQKERVRTFVNPTRNLDSPAAYNARQAMLAINAGGAAGQGWGQGVLNRLRRVPERHTDFIFPVVAEEWGFVRTAPLVGLYMAVTAVLAALAAREADPFGRLIIGGVMALFAGQSLLHMAISLRLAPITGLTLPLMSYGGSSLVSTFAALGLVAGVRMHPPEDAFLTAGRR